MTEFGYLNYPPPIGVPHTYTGNHRQSLGPLQSGLKLLLVVFLSFTKCVRDWLVHRHLPYIAVYGHEHGPAIGLHTHFLLHLPAPDWASTITGSHRSEFRHWTKHWPERQGFKSASGAIRVRGPANETPWLHWSLIHYLLKGYDRRAVVVAARNAPDGRLVTLGDLIAREWQDPGIVLMEQRVGVLAKSRAEAARLGSAWGPRVTAEASALRALSRIWCLRTPTETIATISSVPISVRRRRPRCTTSLSGRILGTRHADGCHSCPRDITGLPYRCVRTASESARGSVTLAGRTVCISPLLVRARLGRIQGLTRLVALVTEVFARLPSRLEGPKTQIARKPFVSFKDFFDVFCLLLTDCATSS